jgi:predicted transcriptional regulator
MTTTIQVKEDIRNSLNAMKIHNRETYNDVLERMMEDLQELNKATIRDIKIALKEIESGDYKTHDDVRKELGF